MKHRDLFFGGIIALLAFAIVIALVGVAKKAEGHDANPEGIRETTITLNDTRRVHCLIYQPMGMVAGISCDWGHADGADNL